MPFQIVDGAGSGFVARVSRGNQLETVAETHLLDHHVSLNDGRAFNVQSLVENTGNTSLLHVRNNSQDRSVVLSGLSIQAVGFSGLPSVNTYISTEFGRTYDSGGVELQPLNLRRNSPNVSDLVCFRGGTITGTGSEWERWYPPVDGDLEEFRIREAVFLAFNETADIRLTTDTTGTVVISLSFLEINPNEQ